MDFTQLEHNNFLSGGLILMLVGSLAIMLKSLPGRIFNLIERFCFVKLEIQDNDEVFNWVKLWLSDALSTTLSVSVISRQPKQDMFDYDNAEFRFQKPVIYFVPAVGTYFFWYERRLISLTRNRKENSLSGFNVQGKDKEYFTLRLFSRDKAIARRLIEECRDKSLPNDDKIDVRVLNHGGWALGTRIIPRTLDSVILDGSQATELAADLEVFLSKQKWYQQVGVPYRRGYLLHGPPGNGKSSVVKALAGKFRMHIYLLVITDPDVTDANINHLLSEIPENNILLIEDIDCAFVGRKTDSKDSKLTFSGLLNALDGVASPESRVVIMTTNHIENLDPALIRPGRVDMRTRFSNATRDQARRLFERFFPGKEELAVKFAISVGDCEHPMAALQEHLMLYTNDPEAAVNFSSKLSNALLKPQGENHVDRLQISQSCASSAEADN
jgi:chaperone BCS1